MARKLYWKALSAGLKSKHDGSKWKIGVWRKTECTALCRGFNCSPRIIDAMGYVGMQVLAQVEARGKHFIDDDKSTWEEMRIVRAWEWKKEDSVELAVYSAELVLKNYEKQYPGDDRPHNAIEAAKKWLRVQTESIAWSAAESAAASAACAAESAAWSAAEGAAASAAWSAAASAACAGKIEKWLCNRVKSLEPYEEEEIWLARDVVKK